jgi:uncharacterized coiled-coil protein SlyX
MLEQELMKKIAESDSAIKQWRLYMADLKKKMTDAETELIAAKIDKENLEEQLRLFRARTSF